MIAIRKSEERGHADHGWLDARHTFSFAHYYDPKYMGFRALRVLNDDTIQPGRGFGMHPHNDMEIVTYVLDGALEHKDNMGNGSVIKAGMMQRMSAGTGVMHSEFNHSKDSPVHLLQIWIEPDKKGVDPGYEEKAFPDEEKQGALRLVVSPDGREGSLKIHQQAFIYASKLGEGDRVEHEPAPGRHLWLHVATGEMRLNGDILLGAGDGVSISGERSVEIEGINEGEVLLFELP